MLKQKRKPSLNLYVFRNVPSNFSDFSLISFSFASVYVVISTSPFLDNASLTKNVVLPEPATADIKRFLFTPIYCIFNILGILQIMFFLKYTQSPICFISLHILRD